MPRGCDCDSSHFRSYSVAAHEALQAKGFAPRLLGYERLPGRWFMVVTEYLPCARIWDHLDAMEMPRGRLREAVGALHAAGFVHGDLRGCNVLVNNEQVCTNFQSGLQTHA